MIKCPNCGSTAQMKVTHVPNPTRTVIIERIVCGCGCVTTATYKLAREETRTVNGTLIGLRKGSE
jgi:transcription initiation factor TFIIIB Brf1 subunit/transcription initiation factor TFIIB